MLQFYFILLFNHVVFFLFCIWRRSLQRFDCALLFTSNYTTLHRLIVFSHFLPPFVYAAGWRHQGAPQCHGGGPKNEEIDIFIQSQKLGLVAGRTGGFSKSDFPVSVPGASQTNRIHREFVEELSICQCV